MSQPKWKTLSSTDYSQVQVDETGVYEPEMEIAQDVGCGRFEVFRFTLERLKLVDGYIVPLAYKSDWPHPLPAYQEWFADSLENVANSCDWELQELREAFCSESVCQRAHAYEDVGYYHGFANLDTHPLTLTEEELDERWSD